MFKDLTPLGMSIKYEVVKNYKLGTNQTDQKDFVTVTEDGIVTPKVFTTTGQAAIDRTPIVRVSLMNGSNAPNSVRDNGTDWARTFPLRSGGLHQHTCRLQCSRPAAWRGVVFSGAHSPFLVGQL